MILPFCESSFVGAAIDIVEVFCAEFDGEALKKSITTTQDSTLITKSRQLKSTDVDL